VGNAWRREHHRSTRERVSSNQARQVWPDLTRPNAEPSAELDLELQLKLKLVMVPKLCLQVEVDAARNGNCKRVGSKRRLTCEG
jgi:hypothetical protein